MEKEREKRKEILVFNFFFVVQLRIYLYIFTQSMVCVIKFIWVIHAFFCPTNNLYDV